MGGCIAKHDIDDITPDTEPMIEPAADESMLILQHGWIGKKSRYLHKFHKRWTVLTSTALYTFKSEHQSSIFQHENGKSYLRMTRYLRQDRTESINLNQYDRLEDFSWRSRALHRMTVDRLKDLVRAHDIYFNLQTSNDKDHVFVFQCASYKDKELWCCHIHQALGNPDFGLILELKSEMQSKPNPPITPYRSKHSTVSLIQGFITIQVENDNVPSAVIEMISDYLFQRIECCFLSKRQPVSGLRLLLDRDRLNQYTSEYSTLRFQNSEWFESAFDLQRMTSDLNNQRYPFEITTLTQGNQDFDAQLLKSVDCTNHNKFKPFDLEYLGSFPNIHLTEGIRRQIVRSEHMQSREVKNSMKEMREKFGNIDEELLFVLAPTMDGWRSRYLMTRLEETKYHLIITKRTATERNDAGYWLHFVDFKCMFRHHEFPSFGSNSYCIQMQIQNSMFTSEYKCDNDDLHRKYAWTYNRNANSVWIVSEVLSDIYSYDLNLLKWSPLGLNRHKWMQRRRDGASLCWLNDRKLMIIGGHREWSKGMCSVKRDVDLYDTETNVLISLSNMREARHNAASLYLKYSNEIAVGSAESVEFYDPSKDFWMLYENETNERFWGSCFMWNDVNNPNILYLGEDRALDNDECHIEWVDRRMNSKWQFLKTPKNVAYFGQFYLNPNAV